MLEDTIARIETRLRESDLPPQSREELERLVAQLRNELLALSEKDEERARSVAAFADVTTHEATRRNADEHLQRLSMDGLSASIREMEASHPELVRAVNGICTFLSNSGI